MRIVKIIFSVLLIALSLAVIGFSGFFLWNALVPRDTTPEVLNTDMIFEEEQQEAPPVFVTAPEDSAEEPPEEEAPPVEEETTPEEPPVEEQPPVEEEEPEDLTLLRQQAAERLASMTLEEKIWQLFIVTPEALTGYETVTRAGEATEQALQERPVGGLVYFSANLEDREQTVEMLSNTQSYAKTGLFLCIDEEGGLVSRAGSNAALGVTHFDAPAEYGSRADMAEVFQVGKTMAQELLALGFNLNFAPVADVVTNENNTEIGSRAYSSDPQIAGAMVSAMVEGLQRGGMIACLKHFPGHGSTETDSHADKSVSNRTPEELLATEWIPFIRGIEKGVAFVMLSHLTNENLSALPASLSREIVACLRQALGFEGIIITDSQQMGAITNYYSSGEAAVKALEAGADMILMPADLQEAYDAVKLAVEAGVLTEERIDESVLRILMVKFQYGILE